MPYMIAVSVSMASFVCGVYFGKYLLARELLPKLEELLQKIKDTNKVLDSDNRCGDGRTER